MMLEIRTGTTAILCERSYGTQGLSQEDRTTLRRPEMILDYTKDYIIAHAISLHGKQGKLISGT